jgi:O-antigen/teichoic acid export membrane protein
MVGSLRSKAIHGLSWSFIESAGLQVVRFIIGIVLARMLLPVQFGLIGMLMIFMSVGQAFFDGGFGAALIQKRDATLVDTCSIFYFNILVGLLAAGALCLASPWIAAFYEQPILTPLARVMSLVIVINSFSLIHITIIQKQIDFKRFTKVSLIASVLSGIIGIIMAVEGFGVWSLVAQQVSGAFFQTLFLWLMNSWRPTLIFSLKSLRQMFSFGSRMLASGLLDQIFSNVYLVAIGKLFSATDLGFFTRARAFQELPSNSLSLIVGRVTFPVFSSIQDDSARLKRGLKKALTTLVLVNFPMMIGLSMVARPLVLLLLTEKWAEPFPYLRLLAFMVCSIRCTLST